MQEVQTLSIYAFSSLVGWYFWNSVESVERFSSYCPKRWICRFGIQTHTFSPKYYIDYTFSKYRWFRRIWNIFIYRSKTFKDVDCYAMLRLWELHFPAWSWVIHKKFVSIANKLQQNHRRLVKVRMVKRPKSISYPAKSWLFYCELNLIIAM